MFVISIKKIYYNAYTSEWVRGNSEIPYIHLDFVERPALKKDEFGNYVPDDKKLNMGVKVPLFNGACRLEFNYYWLKQYLKFLQTIFDSNEDLVVCLPEQFSEVHRNIKQNQKYFQWQRVLRNLD